MIGGVILCIGDSLTNGARSPRNYPETLGEMLSRKYDQTWVGINKGINGETSNELVNRVYDVMRSYPEAHEVIVTIGTNDAKDSVATPIEIYQGHWNHIHNCATFLKKRLYIGLIPDLKGFGAPDYSVRCQERIQVYNRYLEATWAAKHKLIDFRNFADSCYIDGVHMNHEGYVEMAKRALAAIESERQHSK